jgi:hypothetical protein
MAAMPAVVLHHWQAPEFTYKTKRVRCRAIVFASPENYRYGPQIAVDDQPFRIWHACEAGRVSGRNNSRRRRPARFRR